MEVAVITKAAARPGYRLWLRFADGAEGVVDVSDLAGRGVFSRWQTPGEFEGVVLDTEWGTVRWPSSAAGPELDLSPDMLRQRLVATSASAGPSSETEAA